MTPNDMLIISDTALGDKRLGEYQGIQKAQSTWLTKPRNVVALMIIRIAVSSD